MMMRMMMRMMALISFGCACRQFAGQDCFKGAALVMMVEFLREVV